MDDTRASRTAVLVCQGRAAAHGRLAVGRFDDPTALALLLDDERGPVESVRSESPPSAWRDRMEYESVRASAEVMVPRTIAIDDAVGERAHDQIVILGAGLDGRAWRLDGLAEATVFEVDHPASQADKRGRLAELAPRAKAVRFVAVDFTRDSLEAELAAAGHDESTPTTWVWEGVVPYLTPDEVEASVAAIDRRSAAGSRLVVNYQSPSWVTTVGRLAMRAISLVARRTDPLRDEPRRSSWTPATMAALLARHGFTVERDDDLLTLATRLAMTVANQRSIRSGRVAVADR